MKTAAITCVAWFLIISATLQGQVARHAGSSTRDLIESKISAFLAAGFAPGVSVAVVENGKVSWSAGYGMADLENLVHASPETLYRLASLSKTLTATAAMKLWEDGKLDLDAPAQKYCPAFPQKSWPITTRELLGHTAGIRSYRVPEMPYSVSERDPEVGNTIHFQDGIRSGLAFFKDDPLIAEPGTAFNYSTHGYTLVGCVIEGASGQNYADYVREHILIPAGMLHTVPDDRYSIIPLRTRFYSKDASGAVINAELLDASYKVPGGGWLSSALDMAQFEAAMLGDKLLSRKARDAMWTPEVLKNGSTVPKYGLGWELDTSDNVSTVGHSGSQQGASAQMSITSGPRDGVVVLTNADGAPARKLASDILGVLLAAR